MSHKLTIEFPFSDGTADISGTYTPRQQGRMYMPNGDPGEAETFSEFEIESFSLFGDDILPELENFYVKDKQGKYVKYIDSIYDRIMEIADDMYYSESEL